MPACPDCGSSLGKNAHKCRCGWTSSASQVGPHVDCFNAPYCTRPAQIKTDRYQAKGRFQNFCFVCEQKAHDEKAEKWCRESGLISTQQRIEFCRKMAKKWYPGLPASWGQRVVERVPGEDDELAA